jgi:hypothetical protein
MKEINLGSSPGDGMRAILGEFRLGLPQALQLQSAVGSDTPQIIFDSLLESIGEIF